MSLIRQPLSASIKICCARKSKVSAVVGTVRAFLRKRAAFHAVIHCKMWGLLDRFTFASIVDARYESECHTLAGALQQVNTSITISISTSALGVHSVTICMSVSILAHAILLFLCKSSKTHHLFAGEYTRNKASKHRKMRFTRHVMHVYILKISRRLKSRSDAKTRNSCTVGYDEFNLRKSVSNLSQHILHG